MIELLTGEIEDYSRYEKNQLIFLKDRKDFRVKDEMSFASWLNEWRNQDSIKVEGLESVALLKGNFPHLDISTIHLFVNLKGSYSFPKHRDDCDVYLHVCHGSKKIYTWADGEKYINHISTGQSHVIHSGVEHEVDSEKNTWALSIGYKK